MTVDASNPKTPDDAAQNAFHQELATHWHNSLPSIVLAIASLILAGLYYFWVQPHLQSRYEHIRDANLERLGEADLNSLKTTQIESDISLSERIKRLEETLLCVRRLSVWNPGNEELWFQSAKISDLLSKTYLDYAQTLPNADVDKLRPLLAKQETAARQAADGMRRVRKKKSAVADRAAIWLAANALHNVPDVDNAQLSKMETDLDSLTSESLDSLAFRRIQGQVKVLRALRPSSELNDIQRLALLKAANAHFERDSTPSVEYANWAAHAAAVESAKKSKEIAWRAAQDFWLLPQDRPHSIDLVTSVFESLLVSGSIKEAQTLLVGTLEKTSTLNQHTLRRCMAEACLRSIVASNLVDAVPKDPNRNAVLLSMSIQLVPDSLELHSLLKQLATPDPNSKWQERLVTELHSSSDAALHQLVALASIASDWKDQQTQAIAKAIASNNAYCIAASRFSLRLAAEKSEVRIPLIRLLRSINQFNPELFVVWSDRASLHILEHQYDAALECYEYLQSKLPDNREIQDSIEQLKFKKL